MFTNDFNNNDMYYQIKTEKNDIFFSSNYLNKQKVNKNYNYESHKYDNTNQQLEGGGIVKHHYSEAVNLLKKDRPESDYIKSEFYNKYLKPNNLSYFPTNEPYDDVNKIRPEFHKNLEDEIKEPEVKVLENTEKPEVKKIIDKRRNDPAKRLKMKLNSLKHKKINNAAFKRFVNNL